MTNQQLASIRRLVEDARRKLNAAATAEKRGEYGSLLGGRLPIQVLHGATSIKIVNFLARKKK